MKQQEFIELIIRRLVDVQKDSGENEVEIREDTLPYDQLPGFDSLRASELITSLEKDTRFKNANFTDNKLLAVFLNQILTIKEIAETLAAIQSDEVNNE